MLLGRSHIATLHALAILFSFMPTSPKQTRTFAVPSESKSCVSVIDRVDHGHNEQQHRTNKYMYPVYADASTVSKEESNATTKKKRKKVRTKHEIVTFTANNILRSQQLSLPTKAKPYLDDFFTSDENIDLQFADRAEVHTVTQPSVELMDQFRKLNSERRIAAGLPPVAEDVRSTRIISLKNPPMHCLGLVLHSVTHVGIQVLTGHLNSSGRPNPHRPHPGYPEVQLTLLETKFEATGPAMLVGLFYKIMGSSEDSDTGERHNPLETVGFTRIWAEPILIKGNKEGECSSDGAGETEAKEGVVFVNKANIESHIRVPRLLMRVMPLSKEKMERKGSHTLHVAISKDMGPAMKRLTESYETWLSSMEEQHKI